MKCKVKAKGSGSSWCLLKDDDHDEKQWVKMGLQFQIKTLDLSGSFILCTSIDDQLYIWGTFRKNILKQPLMIKKQVDIISCGWDHALVYSHGSLYGIGNNSYKQLGINSTIDYIPTLTLLQERTITHLICGFRQSYFISDGNLIGCGQSKKYQLGISSPYCLLWQIICENIIGKINGQIKKMKCTKRCLFILNNKSQLYVIGYNEQNCCNNSEKGYYNEFSLIFSNVVDFSCGWGHLIILNTNKELLSYGRNNLGQLGRQNDSSTIQLNLNESQQMIEDIICGSQYTFIHTNKSNFYAWGWNEHLNLLNDPLKVIPKPILLDTKCKRLWTYPAITIIQQQHQSL